MPMNRQEHETFVRTLMTRTPDGRAVWDLLDEAARERQIDDVAESEEAYVAFARKLGADVDEASAAELRERERRASAARHAEAQAEAEATVFAERERRESAEVDASWDAWAPILGCRS